MISRIAKEIRLIRPPWLLTVGLLIATAFLPHGSEWAVTFVILACPIIVASIFGGEFAQGTMSQLLAQPIDRRRIWFDKMLVAAGGLGSLLLIMLAIDGLTWPVTVVAVCAFCSIPFYTLVGRNTLSGVILSVPIPGLLFVIGAALVLWLFRGVLDTVDAQNAFNEERLRFWTWAYFGCVLPAYCALLFYLGYRRFRGLEISDVVERQLRLPGKMQVGFERLVGSLFPSRQRPLRALIAKELHFQYNTVTLFLVFALLQVLAILYVKLAHPRDPDLYFVTPFFIYAALMPLIIGSSAIAEERNIGTRAWHLTLPVSARLQWFIKLSVVLLFAALFGIGVPLFWLMFYVPASELPPLFALTLFCTSVFLVTLISFYASSFARDTVRALLTAAGLVIALVFAGSWLTFSVERISVMVRAWFPYLNNVVISSVLLNEWILLGFPLLAFAILLLLGSLKHFRTLDHSRARLWSSFLLVFLPPLFLLFLPLNIAVAVNNPSFRVTSTHPATSQDTSALHPSRSDQNR